MKRWFPLLIVRAAAAGGRAEPDPPPPPPNFAGTWFMHETDKECEHDYSTCWLEIIQNGDRVTIHAWAEDNDWTCDGRGEIKDGKLTFRWAGSKKNWRGTATVEMIDGELRGTYFRDAENSGVQYCRGTRGTP